MQLAFITLFLVFILLPGIAFRLGYLKRDGLLIVSGTKVYIEFIFVVFISLFFHFVFWGIHELIGVFDFKIKLFHNLLTGETVPNLGDKKTAIGLFIAHNIILSTLLFLLGWYLNIRITKTNFQFRQNFQFLEYTGYWDRIFLFEPNKLELKGFDISNFSINTEIDALIEINGEGLLYNGVLKNYYIDKSGYIDKLILEDVTRIKMIDHDFIVSGKNEKENISNQEAKTGEQTNEEKSSESQISENSFEEDLIEALGEAVGEVVVDTLDEFKSKTIKIPSFQFIIYGSTIKNIAINHQILPKEKHML